MKVSKWILFALFNLLFLSLNAQVDNILVFPVTGSFIFEPHVGQQKDFNKVVIESNVFHLKMNEQIVRSYKAIVAIKGGFTVEQFYLDNQNPSQSIEKFNVDISNITENECYFTISYLQGSEKIHLIRQN